MLDVFCARDYSIYLPFPVVKVSARRLVWDSLDRDGSAAALCSSHPGGFDLIIASDCLFFKASAPLFLCLHTATSSLLLFSHYLISINPPVVTGQGPMVVELQKKRTSRTYTRQRFIS